MNPSSDRAFQTEDIGLWRQLRNLDIEFLRKIKKFYIFGDCCGYSVLITEDRVYAGGKFSKSPNQTPTEIRSLRNKNIIKIDKNDFQVYFLVQENGIKNLYSMGYNPKRSPLRFEIENVKKLFCSCNKYFVINTFDEIYYYTVFGILKNFSPPIQPGEKIIDFVCGHSFMLLLSNQNNLYHCSTVVGSQFSPGNHFRIVKELGIYNKSIKKMVSFGINQILLYTSGGLIFHCNYDKDENEIKFADSPIHVVQRLREIVGTPNGYIIVYKDDSCSVWDCYNSIMIKTSIQSISDICCLYLKNTTPILTCLPAEQVNESTLNELTTFNQIAYCDAIFEIKFSNDLILVERSKLIAHSEYFKTKFESEWQDKIFLDEFSYVSMYEYFRYIYTGKFSDRILNDANIMMQIYNVSVHFQDYPLQDWIVSFYYKQFNVHVQ